VIHLDTSFLIRSLVRGSPEDLLLRSWLHAGTVIEISTIALTEFLCGPLETPHLRLAQEIVRGPVPYLLEDSRLAAKLYNGGGRRRGSLLDCMIAATAMRFGAALATTNREDFRRLEPFGLRIAG
jgi:predicted nucleic acid-binding protein